MVRAGAGDHAESAAVSHGPDGPPPPPPVRRSRLSLGGRSGPPSGAGGRPAPPGESPPPGPRTVRLRIREGDPWSVMVTSVLLLAGLGVVALVTTVVMWIMLEALAPNALPSLPTVLAVALGVVVLEVLLGACLATLSTFVYNLSAQYHGGLEVALTDDLTDPTPAAAQALLGLARARARARVYLRTHTPSRVREAVRRLPGDGPRKDGAPPARPQPAADAPRRTAADGLDTAQSGSDTA